MNILIVGSGGREHALAWKIAQSRRADRVFVAPGNAGTATDAENVDISAADIERLTQFAKQNDVRLTVVGPEAPLADGIVDAFGAEGLRIFGLRLYDRGDPEAFLEKLGITYPIGDGAPLATPFAVDQYGLPTLYVIDREGRVVDLLVGFNKEMTPTQLRQAVLEALGRS
jgi:hypothetical protein